MVFAVSRHAAIGAIVLVGLLAGSASAQNDKPKPPAPQSDKSADVASKGAEAAAKDAAAKESAAKETAAKDAAVKSTDSVARYCASVAPIAAEARIAWETRRLNDLDAQIKQRVADLEKAEADTKDWVSKREALLNSASDDVVAIYGKMEPEAAAAQIATMDEPIAVSILHKLKVGAASAILDQMEAARAARLTSLILAAPLPEKKS
jgi:flagellar motility protein MotE (MotC chaperone)